MQKFFPQSFAIYGIYHSSVLDFLTKIEGHVFEAEQNTAKSSKIVALKVSWLYSMKFKLNF